MRKWFLLILATIVLLPIAWAIAPDAVDTAMKLRGADARLEFVHRYVALVDGYTTATMAQKYAATKRMLNLMATARDVREIPAQLTGDELAAARIVWRQFVAEHYAARRAALTAAEDAVTSGLDTEE